ncbi:MAG: PilZ domain-containing protein [Candidatus Aminicenantes bacterium]|nr:PilZ domain-containing protein [Candidatus Aminicenantes bacterium]
MGEKKIIFQERRACIRFKIPGATVNYYKISSFPFFKNKLEESFCPLYDISRGGVRFLAKQNIPLDTPLELEIQIPGEPVSLKMKGKVRWTSPIEGKSYHFQIGVQFFPYGEEKEQNYPGNLVKIIALEQKFVDKPETSGEDEFII